MKVKNTSGEKLIEPYFNVVLEPGEVVDLQEPQLSRVLVSYPGKVQLVLAKEKKFPKKNLKEEEHQKKQEVATEETSE
jgi:hypothetical protein